MPTPEQRDIFQQFLGRSHYDVDQALDAGLHEDVGVSPGVLASLLMVAGHVEMAQAMVARGVSPQRPSAEEAGLVGVAHIKPSEVSGEGVPLAALALLVGQRQRIRVAPAGGRIASRTAVWQQLLSEPEIWPLGLNENTMEQFQLFELPILSSGEAWEERETLLNTFVAAGGDINHATSIKNAVSAGIYDYIEEVDPTFHALPFKDQARRRAQSFSTYLDYLLTLGFDKTNTPHISFAAAVQADSHHLGFYEAGATLGVRAQALVDRGFEISAPTHCPRDVNAYCVAVEYGLSSVVRALGAAECDPRWIDPITGDTLIAIAAKDPKKCNVDALLEIPIEQLKSIANHVNKKGDTPLHQAVASLSLPLVRKLVEAGADINATNKKGLLPLQAGTKTNPKAKKQLAEIVEFFQNLGTQTTPENATGLLHQACGSMAVDLVVKLLDQGADPNERDKQGRTPLNLISSMIKFDLFEGENRTHADLAYPLLVNMLVKAGGDIDAPDKKGDTALHGAMKATSQLRIITLLNTGADPHALNKKKLAPVHVWEGYANIGLDDDDLVMETFANNGLDMNFKGPNGELPLSPLRYGTVFERCLQHWQLSQDTQTPSLRKSGPRL